MIQPVKQPTGVIGVPALANADQAINVGHVSTPFRSSPIGPVMSDCTISKIATVKIPVAMDTVVTATVSGCRIQTMYVVLFSFTCIAFSILSDSAVDEYEKSTNQVVQTNKIHHTVESLQDYDNNDAADSPEICNAPVDVSNLQVVK